MQVAIKYRSIPVITWVLTCQYLKKCRSNMRWRRKPIQSTKSCLFVPSIFIKLVLRDLISVLSAIPWESAVAYRVPLNFKVNKRRGWPKRPKRKWHISQIRSAIKTAPRERPVIVVGKLWTYVYRSDDVFCGNKTCPGTTRRAIQFVCNLRSVMHAEQHSWSAKLWWIKWIVLFVLRREQEWWKVNDERERFSSSVFAKYAFRLCE